MTNLATIAAVIATAGVCWMLHTLDVNRIEAKQVVAVKDQEKTLIAQCKADKAITSEVSNDYQKKIAGLNSRLAELKRLSGSRCVPVALAPTGRDAAAGGGHGEADAAVTEGSLYEFAGVAESYRLRLLACQSFVIKVWEAKQ